MEVTPVRREAGVYAAGHFLVDLACAMVLLGKPHGAVLFLIYNFCAFALQMPIGLLADLTDRCKAFALAGIALVLAARLPVPEMGRVLLAGLGNACYHVGGGRDALLADRKLTGLGIFVAPGALGIFLGGVLAGNSLAVNGCSAALAVCAACLIPAGELRRSSTAGKPRWGWAWLMAAIVLLRSAVGLCMATPWKIGAFAAGSAVCAALGKAAGGFAGDRAGWKRAGVLSLICAAGLFLLPGFGWAGCLGVLLFNMTMPITLRRAAEDLPGMEGFAFGALTFALFLGYLPAYYGLRLTAVPGAVLALVSTGLLALYREDTP